MEEILQTSNQQLSFPFIAEMDAQRARRLAYIGTLGQFDAESALYQAAMHIEQPVDWVDVPPGKTPNVCITTIPPKYTYDPTLDPDVLSWPSTCATPQASDPQDVGHIRDDEG